MDFLGPLPVTKNKNSCILVIVDQFTKWVECIPLPSQTAEVTARAAINEFFTRFGCPLQIFTNQGTNFTSELFSKMCEILKIHKTEQLLLEHQQMDKLKDLIELSWTPLDALSLKYLENGMNSSHK
jgi:transposase InsO family protein